MQAADGHLRPDDLGRGAHDGRGQGRPWAAIHDNARIPVDFRLYLTATPRILTGPSPQRGRDGREVVIVSMEDGSATYDTRIFDLRLAELVKSSILAGCEIDVLESPAPTRSSAYRRTRCLAGAWHCSKPRSWSTRRR